MGPLNDPVLGVDVGQKRDPTALCVAVPELRQVDGRAEVHFLIRTLKRLPLETPYPEVARKISTLAERVRERAGIAGRPLTLFLDATGVGLPVGDLLRRAPHLDLVPVCFTHGRKRSVRAGRVSLGKAYLVSRLQALLAAGRLHLPRHAEAQALALELLNYEIRVSANASDRYGAFRSGTHDDLVTALGLAVQVDP